MTNSFLAEVYFIVTMMILILILSAAATVFFVRQYKREKRENPLTRKNLANFQANLEKNKQTNEQTEYVEK